MLEEMNVYLRVEFPIYSEWKKVPYEERGATHRIAICKCPMPGFFKLIKYIYVLEFKEIYARIKK